MQLAHLQEQVNDWSVVYELDVLALDPLLLVLIQLPLEDVLVEVELQLLVGSICTQLLKTVSFKVLEACDVEDTNRRPRLSHPERMKPTL